MEILDMRRKKFLKVKVGSGWRSARFIFCLLLIANCFLVNQIFAKGEDASLFNKANELYKVKHYEEAIALYDSIIKSGYSSSELFFNLGNAHFKVGHLAPAILNYERAKKLSPSDEDIDFNLRIANLRVVDRVDAVPELFFVRWTKDLIVKHSSDGWAKLALIMIWVTFVFGTLFLFINNLFLKRIGFFVAMITLLLSFACGFLAYHQYNYQRTSQEGVVFVKNVYVKSAPDQQSTDLFMLREGIKVALLQTEGEWQKIQLADGKVGWMRKDGLQAI